ncbi:glycosyltransferase [Marinibacterium sp. SX1]|uniref:glycosyltransferase n=1 Tax=Marinibacterium sp. SX1 TaxID=3388424 RepID=UPI003D16FCC7
MTPAHPKARETYWRGRVVLVVSPTPTHPQDYGNRRRIYRVCKMLQDAGAAIHFVHYASEAEWRGKLPARAQQAMMEEWDGYYLVPPTRDLHSDPAGTHHGIDEWWDPQLEATLGWLGDKILPDVAIVNYTWLSRALDFMPRGTLRILDTHDKFSGRKELLGSYGIAPEFFYTTEDDEKIALDRADIVWAIKDEERLLFQAMTAKPVVTVPHADPGTYLPRRAGPADPADHELRIGVMGARNSINLQNLNRFLDVAAPLFRTYLPPLRIVIGGTICEMLDHCDLPFVEKVGWVEDVEDFYRDIDVALVPMEFSTGLKIKTSEAMTFGLPVISHAHAFEGYTPFHPHQALASFTEIAEACIDLAHGGPDALDQLRLATMGSHRAVSTAMQKGVDATGAMIAETQSYTLICPGLGSVSKGSLFEALARSTMTYLGHRSPIALYFDEIPDVSGLARFCMSAPASQIYVNSAARAQLAPKDIEWLENTGIRWSGFAALLSHLRIRHLWLGHVPGLAGLHATPAFDRIYLDLPNLHCTDIDTIIDTVGKLTGPFTSVSVLANSDTPAASRLRKALRAEMTQVLPFWGKEFPLMWDMSPIDAASRYGITVILETASPAIIQVVSELAAMAGQPLLNVIHLDDESTEIRRVHRTGLEIRYLPPKSLTRANLGLLRGVSTTVNFAPSSLFARMLVSIMRSAGQDVIIPAPEYDPELDRMRNPTLLGFMRDLHDRLQTPRETGDPGDRYAALFDYDPGWAAIWAQY